MTPLDPKNPPRPRVLRVDLARLAGSGGRESARIERFFDPDKRLDRIGCASGSALAHVLLHRAVERNPTRDCPLVFSVGCAVRAALPTAARTSVLSRSPLTGFLSEGQVGGGFARALASVVDALVLSGESGMRGAVLVVDAAGELGLHSIPELVNATPRAAAAHLARRFGEGAALAIGAAGEARIPFASLVALEDPPSFVGRGGLGAVVGRMGLKAIVVLAPPVEPDPLRADRDRELQRTLLASPRLRARAAGGTLELAASLAARGALNVSPASTATVVADFERVQSASVGKKGCDGCPTPCGLVFERGHPSAPTRHGGRFGALLALGSDAQFEAETAQALLARCDELALDAKETGAVLALARRADPEEGTWGRERSLALLDDIVARRGVGEVLAHGARSAAIALDLTDDAHIARGESARSESNLALRLASAVSVRGSDPMRMFPFLAVDSASRERLVTALAPVAIPPHAENPHDPAGKGRIVWWHENLACALDATGFCAFSAAGLISDGVCTVDELARQIAPESIANTREPGRALLALGASVATLQRATTALLGIDAVLVRETPTPDELEMCAEYAQWRGLELDGAPTKRALELMGDEGLLDLGPERDELVPDMALVEPRIEPEDVGAISFSASGPLHTALAGVRTIELPLPARLDACVARLALAAPSAAPWLVIREQMVPQAWRRGTRLAPSDAVFAGDQIQLVIAIGGG